MSEKNLLSVEETAAYLSVGKTSVITLASEGLLVSFPVGPRKSLRFLKSDIDAYITRRRQEAAVAAPIIATAR